jgi:YidC/Oxa1 family membrane protein insertase
MDRRFLLALLLSGAVIVMTPVLFPRTRPTPPAAALPSPAPGAATPAGTTPAATPTIGPATTQAIAPPVAAVRPETLTLGNELTTLRFSSVGASLIAVDLPRYRQLGGREGTVQLTDPAGPLLRHRILAGGDTVPIASTAFRTSRTLEGGREQLRFSASIGSGRVEIAYTISADNYLADVQVSADGLPAPVFLLTDLPSGFVSQEADTLEDQRHLAYAFKPTASGAERVDFRSPDPGELIIHTATLEWAVAKSKYFLIGALTPSEATSPFAELRVTGAPRTSKVPSRAAATLVTPLGASGAHYELYAGPQEWQRLVSMGRSFENANPYGGWISGVVQPFATIVMRILLWLKRTTNLEYGWILVIFGVAIRIAMWPLNSRMMRSSLAMQRVAPLVQAAQNKHKGDVEKQREAVMKVYKEHNVSPFAALSGCLPLLLTMPVLIALFFVFQNTIEFRGVSFLWLPDITLKDPYYVLPLAMGGSMYFLSWLSMRNVPPNPQTKMMSWMMPLIMTAFLFNFASGLNLYYTVQNLAALPQQWLIARERAKAAPVTAVVDGGERKKR